MAKVVKYKDKKLEALVAREQNQVGHEIILKVLKKYKDNTKDNWEDITKEVAEQLHTGVDYAGRLVDLAMCYAIVDSDKNATDSLRADVLNHLIKGMYESYEAGDRYSHREYARMLGQIASMLPTKDSAALIGMFQKGDAKGIIASTNAGDLIKAIRQAMDTDKLPMVIKDETNG